MGSRLDEQHQGVTFDIGGEERAFPLDILPRVIEMETWTTIERGVQQRVRTLEAFLSDVYDAGQVFADGVVPRGVVATSSHFHRAAAGIRPANGVRVHVSGIDLIRDDEGEFRMLAVSPAARGRGVGRVLVERCLERSRELGYAGVRMSSMDRMTSAHRVYERLGFTRAPEDDWSPVPGVNLVAYALSLQAPPAT